MAISSTIGSALNDQMHILPDRFGNAFDNMAEDLLLLEDYPEPEAVRFRHYGWTGPPAFTFGYSQKFAWVEAQIATPGAQICRRPTGGGIVDHRHDWTYSIVFPPSHSFSKMDATHVYNTVHQALANALMKCGLQAELASAPKRKPGKSSRPTVCFEKAEPCDVIDPATKRKIAGAALKRNRHGLLLQGSITQTPKLLPPQFKKIYTNELTQLTNSETEEKPWPQFPKEKEKPTRHHYQSKTWNQRR